MASLCRCLMYTLAVTVFYMTTNLERRTVYVSCQDEREDGESSDQYYYEYEYEYEYQYEDNAEIYANEESKVDYEEALKLQQEQVVTNPRGYRRNPAGGISSAIQGRPLISNILLSRPVITYTNCVKEDESDDEAAQKSPSTNKKEKTIELRTKKGKSPGGDKEEEITACDEKKEVCSQSSRKVGFKEAQEQRSRERQEQQELQGRDSDRRKKKSRLGPSCPRLVCGACKAVVDEFASAVLRGINDTSIEFVHEIADKFCEKNEIQLKYYEVVHEVCDILFMEEKGFKDLTLKPFEDEVDHDWDTDIDFSAQKLFEKKRQICVSSGACTENDFSFSTTPTGEIKGDDDWAPECFACRAVANAIEEQVAALRVISDGSSQGIVRNICDSLQLPEEADKVCQEIMNGQYLNEISWSAKLHGEAIAKGDKAEILYPEKLCVRLKKCEIYIDPIVKQRMLQEREVEAVFA